VWRLGIVCQAKSGNVGGRRGCDWDLLPCEGPRTAAVTMHVVQLKADKTGAVAEVNLLKKLHKTELNSEKELSKKEIQAKSITIKSLEAMNKNHLIV
jgi:hypothetical protein